jgi:hypothetical protein
MQNQSSSSLELIAEIRLQLILAPGGLAGDVTLTRVPGHCVRGKQVCEDSKDKNGLLLRRIFARVRPSRLCNQDSVHTSHVSQACYNVISSITLKKLNSLVWTSQFKCK